MKVLVATEKPFAAAAVNGIKAEIEAAGNELVLLEKYTEKAQFLDAVKDADALIIRSDKVDAEVLDAAKQLKIVVRAGAGYDNIDLAAATAHNVGTQTPLPSWYSVCWSWPFVASTTVRAEVSCWARSWVFWLSVM